MNRRKFLGFFVAAPAGSAPIVGWASAKGVITDPEMHPIGEIRAIVTPFVVSGQDGRPIRVILQLIWDGNRWVELGSPEGHAVINSIRQSS